MSHVAQSENAAVVAGYFHTDLLKQGHTQGPTLMGNVSGRTTWQSESQSNVSSNTHTQECGSPIHVKPEMRADVQEKLVLKNCGLKGTEEEDYDCNC